MSGKTIEVVKSLVEKHGTHDQKTHGRRKIQRPVVQDPVMPPEERKKVEETFRNDGGREYKWGAYTVEATPSDFGREELESMYDGFHFNTLHTKYDSDQDPLDLDREDIQGREMWFDALRRQAKRQMKGGGEVYKVSGVDHSGLALNVGNPRYDVYMGMDSGVYGVLSIPYSAVRDIVGKLPADQDARRELMGKYAVEYTSKLEDWVNGRVYDVKLKAPDGSYVDDGVATTFESDMDGQIDWMLGQAWKHSGGKYVPEAQDYEGFDQELEDEYNSFHPEKYR